MLFLIALKKMFLQFRLVYLMLSFIIDFLLFFVEDTFINNMLKVLGLFSDCCHSCLSGLSFSLEALLLPVCFLFSLMCNALYLSFRVLMLFTPCCELGLLCGMFLFDTVFFSKCKLLLLIPLCFESFLLMSLSFSLGMCFSF